MKAAKSKRIWRAMTMTDKDRCVTAVPFLVDPYEGNEEPEEAEDGCVSMVKFPFSPEDYELLKALQTKQTADQLSRCMKIGQMALEKRVSDLLADILGDYIEQGTDEYPISATLKMRANEILKTDWSIHD